MDAAHTTHLAETAQLAQEQWIALSDIVATVARDTGTSSGTAGRLLDMLGLPVLRPLRVSSNVGAGAVMRDNSASVNDELWHRAISHQLNAQLIADESLVEIAFDLCAEYPVTVLIAWLDRVMTDSNPLPLTQWRQWQHDHAERLSAIGLLEGDTTTPTPTPTAKGPGEDSAPTNSLTLSPNELVELTGRTRGYAQRTRLNELGISSRLRSDGQVIVFRADVSPSEGRPPTRKAKPDFDALD